MWIFISAFFLGIIEGLTEFLPISSTGHLIIFSNIFKMDKQFEVLFNVFIQIGAIAAVVYYYRTRIIESLQSLAPGEKGFLLWSKVFVAFIPAAILGVLFNDIIDTYLFNPITVACALIVGGFFIIFASDKSKAIRRQNKQDGKPTITLESMTYIDALKIGLFQCLALIPGMSRSASTIIGGLLLGMSSYVAADFSFFLAIPTISAASVFSLIKYDGPLGFNEIVMLIIGTVTSFIVALYVIRVFLGYLKSHSMKIFALYRFALGFIIIIFALAQLIISLF